MLTCVQAAHSCELEREREEAKESIAAALQEERETSKVKYIHVYTCTYYCRAFLNV